MLIYHATRVLDLPSLNLTLAQDKSRIYLRQITLELVELEKNVFSFK